MTMALVPTIPATPLAVEVAPFRWRKLSAADFGPVEPSGAGFMATSHCGRIYAVMAPCSEGWQVGFVRRSDGAALWTAVNA